MRDSTQPVPVVLGGENGALPIVRALAKIGLRSIVASERKDDITFHSRYCAEKILLKEFEAATDEENVATLRALSQRFPTKPVLFWGSDREVLFLNRTQQELSKWYRFVMCDSQLSDRIVDKAQFSLLAGERGLPVPVTMFFYSRQEILDNLHRIPLPCIIKPVFMKDWYTSYIKVKYGSYKHALHRLASVDEVRDFIKDLPNIDKGVVVQEFIDGRDEYLCSFHAYVNNAGEPVAAFVGRKIRTSPIHFGGSAFIETFHDDEFMQLGLEVCRKIPFKGIVKIDFKRNARTNKLIILELNPRFTLWNYLGAFAGINIPALWYRDLSGETVRPTMEYKPHRRWVCFRADIRALPAYLKAGEWTLLGWLKSYMAPKVYHTFAWDDPWPLVFTLPRFISRRLKLRQLRKTTHID